MTNPFYVALPHRGIIHIEGNDRVDFLQGLISNDVTKLTQQRIQYACLLTPQGKFLHDFFLHHGGGFILIDCEGGDRAEDLFNRLNRYRLRADVQLSFEASHKTYAMLDEAVGLPDPRHVEMGYRSFEKPNIEEKPFKSWDKHRIRLGIPDGSRDMELERSTMLECNLDKLNAIDWDKGCYMGQELTARMHHRNLGKKHLHVIEFNDTPPPAPFTDIIIDDKPIGQMRSSCDTIGLALIRDDRIETLNNNQSKIRLLN